MQKTNISLFVSVLLLAFVASGCQSPVSVPVGYKFVKTWGSPGRSPGKLAGPIGVALAGDEVFISDVGTTCIQVFDRDGNFIRRFGKMGSEVGDFDHPMHISIRGERLYVPDYRNNRVQIFSLAGDPLASIGEKGSEPGQFYGPGGVAADEEGHVYVADFLNRRIQLLDADGAFIRQMGTGVKGVGPLAFGAPTDIALRPGGGFVVSDGINNRIQAFGPDWTLDWMVPEHTTEPDAEPGRFRMASTVWVDSNVRTGRYLCTQHRRSGA